MKNLLLIALTFASTTLLSQVPHVRAHHELIYDPDRKVVVMSNGSTPLDADGSNYKFFNDVWEYDGKRWTQTGTAGDERSGVKYAYDTKRKKLFSLGGYANNESLSELRVLENGDWKTVSNLPSKASEPGFVYDSDRDRLIAFGGSVSRGVINATTWEWDGNSWQKINIESPQGRIGMAMVYDTKRKRTILFSGMGSGPNEVYDDTWEYDGKQWTKVSDTGPGGRTSPGCTYDSKRGLMLIFGGFSKTGVKGDLWSWDGKAWKLLSDSGPSARVMGYLAYDASRDRVILFGGRPGWPIDANDTWEWDGVKWTEVKF